VDYDPVCVDLRSRGADGDCCVVKFDHEDILIRETLTIVSDRVRGRPRPTRDTEDHGGEALKRQSL
jgi:hypothetical protein